MDALGFQRIFYYPFDHTDILVTTIKANATIKVQILIIGELN